MTFNGSGTFVRLYNWVNDAAANIKIRADRMDLETDGIATGLSTCLTKDGQTTATVRIPFAVGTSAMLGAVGGVSYAFTSDSDTGIYSPAANKVGVVAGSTEQLRIESALVHGVTTNTVDLGSTSIRFKDGWFAGSVNIGGNATSAGILKIFEDTDDGTNSVSIKVPALAGDYTLTLPTTDGSASEVLSTDGSGVLSWTAVGSAGRLIDVQAFTANGTWTKPASTASVEVWVIGGGGGGGGAGAGLGSGGTGGTSSFGSQCSATGGAGGATGGGAGAAGGVGSNGSINIKGGGGGGDGAGSGGGVPSGKGGDSLFGGGGAGKRAGGAGNAGGNYGGGGGGGQGSADGGEGGGGGGCAYEYLTSGIGSTETVTIGAAGAAGAGANAGGAGAAGLVLVKSYS